MTSPQPNPDQTTAPRPARSAAKLASALTRYRVMAFVTGGFLLLLCTVMLFKYGFNGG